MSENNPFKNNNLVAGVCYCITKSDAMGSLEQGQKRKATCRRRITLCVTRYSTNYLDPDNLSGSVKALVDCLRQCGLIKDDNQDSITLEVNQIKVHHRREKGTVVEIIYE